jgi:proteasome lid subunit RPN8/RPN11
LLGDEMKIVLKKSDFEKMYEHALKDRPDEACGLIAGIDREDGVREIKKVYLLENIDHTNEHFTISPKDQLTSIKDMRANGLTPLGNWHSHPESPSRPSEEDKRLANDSKASYLILSLMEEGNPVLNAFHVEGEQGDKIVRKEDLVIVDD